VRTEKIAHPRFRWLTAKPKHFVCPIARLLRSATKECLPFRQTLLHPDRISTDHTLWRKDKIEPARPDCPAYQRSHLVAPMKATHVLLAENASQFPGIAHIARKCTILPPIRSITGRHCKNPSGPICRRGLLL